MEDLKEIGLFDYLSNPFYQIIVAACGFLGSASIILLSIIFFDSPILFLIALPVALGIFSISILILTFAIFILVKYYQASFLSDFKQLVKKTKYLLTTVTIVAVLIVISIIVNQMLIAVLAWNLILGYIAYFLSQLVVSRFNKNKKIGYYIFLLMWFFFYPNSIYIFTDFIHLQQYDFYQLMATSRDYALSVSGWTSLVLISISAIYSAYLGILSLKAVLKTINIKPLYKNFLLFGYLVVASFGIYLGRFIRLNSWDFIFIFNHLGLLLKAFTYLFVGLFTALQVLLFIVFKPDSQEIIW